MKNKLQYIFLVLILFFILTCIFFYTLKLNNNNFINNYSVDNSTTTYIRIDNSPKKIKISNSNVQDETPFICFVSDESHIEEFNNFFNSLTLENAKSFNDFKSIYDITFYGDANNIIISLSKDKILQVTNETQNIIEYYKISDNIFSKISNLIDVKYYLHQSSLEIPTSSTCTKAQDIILYGMSNSEISTLKENIRNIHSLLEFHLIDRVKIIKNANNIYWGAELEDEIFIQPNGIPVQAHGFCKFRDSLKNISNVNTPTKEIINDIIFKLEQGMNNHDISECFEAHKILHDLDYWMINYPMEFLNSAPADWGGIHCYYGSIENYNLN